MAHGHTKFRATCRRRDKKARGKGRERERKRACARERARGKERGREKEGEYVVRRLGIARADGPVCVVRVVDDRVGRDFAQAGLYSWGSRPRTSEQSPPSRGSTAPPRYVST